VDAFLIDRWTSGTTPLRIVDEASVSVARQAVRTLAASLGFGTVEEGSLAIVVSELANNQLVHARSGVIAMTAIEREGTAGIEVIAADTGPGIVDPTRALAGSGSSAGGLGVGLSGVLRLADEVDFDVRLGQGTCVRARKFVRRLSRRREVAILGRPHRDERRSGDDAAFVRQDDMLVLALADGLGHGPDALTAASGAIESFRSASGRSPSGIVEQAGAAIVGTRGAVLTVVALDESQGSYEAAGVGNVAFHLLRPTSPRIFTGASFVLGAPGSERRAVATDRGAIGTHDVVMLVSDGLKSRVTIEDRSLLHRHPIVIAHHVLEHFGRDNDDATVVIAC